MSPEERDTFIAEIRLPILRRERDDLTRQLAAMFASIGFAIDWAWTTPENAASVQELLTGAPADTDRSMPVAARHAWLIRRRDDIDKAIQIAQKAAQRVAWRLQEQRLDELMPELRKLARARTLAALQLQEANRRFFGLLEEVGGSPIGLAMVPSIGAELLGRGDPGDEVADLVEAMRAIGILTYSEAANAGK